MSACALITGASSGIGAELARVYAEHEHDVVLVARREDKLNALAQELRRKGVAAHVVAMDLSLKESPAHLFETVRDLGLHVDVLVNNAGFTYHGPFIEMDATEVADMVQVDMATLAALTHRFVGPMIAAGDGRILNVSSTTAFQPVPGFALYSAGKAFVLSLSESLSEELKGTGVSVTVLCPGLTASEMVDRVQADGTLPQIPAFLIADARSVAREGYEAAQRRDVVRIPGIANQMGALWAQSQPRWLVRSLTGVFGRQFMR